MKISVNKMIQAIERKVCIRKIWRCKAGWGMSFCVSDRRLYTNPDINHGVTYSYQPTLEKCVDVNYNYWVLNKNQRGYPDLNEWEFVKVNEAT